MSTITREAVTPALARELGPLIRANHDAVGRTVPCDPAWSTYMSLEAAGNFCLLVVRVDGVPVGYCGLAFIPSHASGLRIASTLAIYLDPKHRGLAKALIREAESQAEDAGCASIHIAVPHLSSAGPFLETVMGYRCDEISMSKDLTV